MTDTRMQGAAVIGAGVIGAAHLEALRRLGVNVAGILGRDEASTRERAAELKVHAYASLAELLADPAVTVVHNCGPNQMHAGANLAALRAGKHVLSEKPLGVSVAECRAQLEAATRLGLRHGVNFTYRGYAAVQTLRELALSGELGELRYVRGHYLQDWLLLPDDYNWRTEAAAEATRTVADIGSHLADLTRYVTGREPERVLARFSRMHGTRLRPERQGTTFGGGAGGGIPYPVQTEDQASVWADYAGGLRATLELSQVAAGHKNDLMIELLGTQGSARWHQENPEEIIMGSREQQRIIRLKQPGHPFTHYPPGHPEGLPDAITNVFRAFYGSLGGTALPYPTFADGLSAAQFVEAAYHSQLHERWTETGNPETGSSETGSSDIDRTDPETAVST